MPLFKEFLCLGREKFRVRGGHVQGQNPCAVGTGRCRQEFSLESEEWEFLLLLYGIKVSQEV